MSTLLRIILGLTGLALAVIGLNTALGGMATLGWQFPSDAVLAGESLNFARHDSNARFFGGTFTGLGLVIASAAVWPAAMATAAATALLAIAVGGLFRLTQTGYSPIGDLALLPSTLAEILLAPALAFWVFRSAERTA